MLDSGSARGARMQLEIRKIRPDEIGRALEILAQWNMAPFAPNVECPEPERTELSAENTFVALAEGSVVGVASYILLGDGCAETASLAVAPAWRGKGVGELLHRARLAELKALGVRSVRTEADRPETIEWYVRKFGYRIVGTAAKKHAFSLPDVGHWTVLTLDLADRE